MTSQVITYFLESGICLLTFYLFFLAFLKDETCFRFNRFYLLLSSLIALIIPLISIPVYTQQTSLTGTVITELTELPVLFKNNIRLIENHPSSPVFDLATYIYIAGIAVLIFKLLLDLRKIAIAYKAGEIKTDQNGKKYKFVITKGFLPTFSFLNLIFWDSSKKYNPRESEQILRHEEEHVKQKHSLDILYFEVLKIFMWFNPVIYLYRQAISVVHEYLADLSVISSSDKKSYSALLAKLAIHNMENKAGVGSFFGYLTLKRIKMMQKRRHQNLIKRLAILPMLIVLFVVFSCDQEFEDLAVQGGATILQKGIPASYSQKISEFREKNPDKHYFFEFTDELALTQAIFDEKELEIVHTNQLTRTEFIAYLSASYGDNHQLLSRLYTQMAPLTGFIYQVDNLDDYLIRDHFDDDHMIHETADVMPHPRLGLKDIQQTISESLQIPAAYQQHYNPAEVIWVEFVVNSSGNVVYTNIASDIYYPDQDVKMQLFGAAIKAVTATSRRWTPGQKDGKNVNVRMLIPVELKNINSENERVD